MKNFIKVSVPILAVAISLFVFAGCGKESPVADPSALLQQSIYNLFEVSSLRYDAVLAADVSNKSIGGSISADFNLNGAFNHTAEKKSNFELNTVANLKDEKNQEYKVDFSMREINDKIYVQLLEAPLIPGLATDGFKDFVGPWWQIDTTQLGAMGENLGTLDNLGAKESELDENGRKLRQLLLTSKFFSNIEYKGTENVDGSPAYVFSVSLDKEGIAGYLKSVAEIGGQAPTAEEEADLVAGLSVMDFGGDVYVDVAASVLVKVDGEFTLTDPSSGEKSAVDADFSVSALNKPFEIKEPTDFKVFDLGAFFGAFLGAGMTSGVDAAVGD